MSHPRGLTGSSGMTPRSLLLTQDFPPAGGGIARMYGELTRRMMGVEVCTVAGSSAPAGDVPFHTMPFDFRRARRAINVARWCRWTEAHVAAHDVRLLHIGNVRPCGYVGAWVHHRTGLPCIVYVHGKDLMKERRKAERRGLGRLGSLRILGSAAAIVANSRATAASARELLAELGLDAERVKVVHPGADPVRFRADPEHGAAFRRATFGARPLLLSVARLMPRKGIDTVIRALPAIRASIPDVAYVVVGTGPDASRLRALAVEQGVADRVHFMGEINDETLAACYASADLFVLPTRTIQRSDEVEGFGLVYAEAAAAGLPAIAANSGGAPDAVEDGVTGWLVEPDSAWDVALVAVRVLRDRPLIERFGRAARLRVERYLNWDRAAAELGALTRAIVAGRVDPSNAPPAPAPRRAPGPTTSPAPPHH